MKTLDIDKNSVGLASELFVIAHLLTQGFQASLTFGKTKNIDILASLDDVGYSFQVKGAARCKKNSKSVSWRIQSDSIKDHIWYVFVNLNLHKNKSNPGYYVLCGKCLKNIVGKRNYVYVSKIAEYEDNWDLD